MARVPEQKLGISEQVPGANGPLSRQFGVLGNAEERLGTDISGNAIDLNAQLTKLQAIDSSSQAYAQTQVDTANKISQLKLQSPDGFMHNTDGTVQKDDQGQPRTITQEFHEWASQHYQDQQESLPSGMAVQMYQERALPHLSEQTALMHTDAMQMRVNASKLSEDTNAKTYGDALATSPSTMSLYKAYDAMAVDIQSKVGTVYNQTEANERMQQAYTKLGRDVMQGAYTNVLQDKKLGNISRVQTINQWRQVLAGKDPISQQRSANGQMTLANGMDPVQKSVEEEKLIRLLVNADAMDKSDLDQRTREASAGLQSGEVHPDALKALFNGWDAYARQDPQRRGGEASDKMAGLVGDMAVGAYMGRDSSTWDAKSPAARQLDIAGVGAKAKSIAVEQATKYGVQNPEYAGTMAANSAQETLQQQYNRVEAEKNHDMAGFAQRILPSGQKVAPLFDPQNFSLGLLAQNAQTVQQAARDQDTLTKVNPPSEPGAARGPITKAQSSQIAAQLSDPSTLNERAAAQGIYNLKDAYGPYAPSVMQQMINDGKLDPKWQVAMLHANDKDLVTMTAIVSAARSGPEVDKLFKEQMETKNAPSAEQNVKDSVHKYFGDYISANAQAYPLGVARQQLDQSTRGLGETYAKQLMIDNPDLSPDDAAHTAYQQMIGSHWHTDSVGGGWRQTSSRQGSYGVPTNVDGRQLGDKDFANIRTNLNEFMKAENLAKYPRGVQIPSQANGQPSVVADKFLPMVSGNAHPVYSDGDKGFKILYSNQGTDGIQSPERTLLDGRGDPVIFHLNDALRTPSAPAIPKTEKWQPGVAQ